MPSMPTTAPSTDIVQIKITLLGTDPPVWRRLLVPAELNFARLHDCIQVSMGWTFSHLHEFRIGDRRYGVPVAEFADPAYPIYRDSTLKLSAVLARGIRRFHYTYDFGDDWQHEIEIEQTLPAQPGMETPRFVDGQRRCPPEDCGGVPGFKEFLEAMADPNHPEHQAVWNWYGDDYDPDDIEKYIIDIQLDRIAAARRGGIKGRGKPKKTD